MAARFYGNGPKITSDYRLLHLKVGGGGRSRSLKGSGSVLSVTELPGEGSLSPSKKRKKKNREERK